MPRAPNLLFIFTDEQAAGTVGAYGNAQIRTPNIDRLAATSSLFESAYVSQPVCTPSRSTLLTGLYPQRFGADFDGALGKRPGREVGLPLHAITLAEVLKQHGYALPDIGERNEGKTE